MRQERTKNALTTPFGNFGRFGDVHSSQTDPYIWKCWTLGDGVTQKKGTFRSKHSDPTERYVRLCRKDDPALINRKWRVLEKPLIV